MNDTRTVPVPYAVAALLGAALLFSIEPLIGKLLLPRLGGVPAVWNTCLLFFQGMLLAGYAYTHYGVRLLGVRRHAVLHAVLLAGSLLLLPPGLPETAPPAAGSPVPWLLLVLVRGIGLPFLLISATAPLVQAWYASADRERGRDPYFLYAASNVGSLLGLCAYPLLIEPSVGLHRQTLGWSGGYGAFAVLLIALALRARRSGAAPLAGERAAAPSAAQAARWTGIAFVPSALLLAVTGTITTDVAPMPLLWMLPLALYLGTFVLAFGQRTPRGVRALALVLVPLTVLVGGAVVTGFSQPVMLLAHLLLFTVIAYVAHARLAADRPATSQLTAFYLWLGVGGTLGGVFGAIVAPLLLLPELEYAILLIAGLLLIPARRRIPVAALAVALLLIALAFTGRVLRGYSVLLAERNFFGTLRVRDFGPHRDMMHGQIMHGAQVVLPHLLRTTTTYYAVDGPLGDIFPALLPGEAKVAVLGAGTGTAACFSRLGDRWDFFEINEAVIRVASDPRYFRFLQLCAPEARLILGDGRRAIAARPAGHYDMIVLDAFSSDAVPTHLLTREAFEVYLSRLAPDGVLLANISNRHLELEPLLAAHAATLGLTVLARTDDVHRPPMRVSSTWAVLARRPERLRAVPRSRWYAPQPEAGFRAWTDDYTSLLPLVRALR